MRSRLVLAPVVLKGLGPEPRGEAIVDAEGEEGVSFGGV